MALVDDLYSTRTLVQAIDKLEAFKPRRFLAKTFFTSGEEVEGEILEIDIRKGARRVAEFVHPKHKGILVERRPFETKQMRPPYIKLLSESSAADMLKRKFGETIYRKGISGAEHAARQLGEELQEIIDMIDRKIELMAAEALLEGKLTLSGIGYDAEIDFSRNILNDVTLAGSDLWSDAASNPLKQILAWKNIIAKLTGLSPEWLILGSESLDAFLDNTKVQAFMDNRRMEIGRADMRAELTDGIVLYANVHGVNVISYEEYYELAGVDTPIIPSKEALMAVPAPKAKNKLHYGAIQNVEAGQTVLPYWADSWVEKNPSTRQLSVETSPLTALHEPDTCLRATTLV